ncbi:hypothetical protein [Janibacter massiliensis]|uniref:hypothetical protein n=1 Tax=Janibacter massiliensis TaxID=2058291 RepID=UPI000D101900|nr:hypothetical protein [Janibacter massiliensis]
MTEPTDEQRRQVAEAIRAQSDRLAADCDRRAPRAAIRCEHGCLLFTVYDHERLGRVVVKRPMTRGTGHAEIESTSQTSPLLAAPVEVLIAAAGGNPVAGLLACEDHLEATLSPDGLRWFAQRTGTYRVDFAARAAPPTAAASTAASCSTTGISRRTPGGSSMRSWIRTHGSPRRRRSRWSEARFEGSP